MAATLVEGKGRSGMGDSEGSDAVKCGLLSARLCGGTPMVLHPLYPVRLQPSAQYEYSSIALYS